MIRRDELCPGCHSTLEVGLRPWHRVCANCTYEGSTLSVDIDIDGSVEVVDEAMREEGLEHLRQRNFQTLTADLGTRIAPADGMRPRLLDVGCAHGWFLEATRPHFDVVGIEPDTRIAAIAEAKGLDVRKGFFPDALADGERFDVIIFNDVLEHIPDIDSALVACTRHLTPGGWIVVNAPARTGVLYRISKAMAGLGMPASFDRMWQKDFPSPHVHYLDDASVAAIAAHHGLRVSDVRTLPSMSNHGLYARIRTDRSVSFLKAVALTSVLTLASPVLSMMPADIKVWLLQVA
ncbi:class I SAM-dependent methyltransferase [Stenotrophomonas sp. GD03777]|uniref:class I SAM-dependent methyltransferase n=1 Tax=Stenotrophomonas TaxID=40323 RepID=UPI00244B82AA|nr:MULTISPECIES: class I SAM-dependent methyltransferase [Stenotrophomonas]MDH1661030.1 class I SAM-dependent methyltransferase [Stenotrophomonas sp. GD03777]